MSQDIIYVRNNRPNAVLVRVDGLKYTVERRGSREDTAALPGDWRNKPPVSTFLHQGILEEISKDAFMTLGSRPEETIIEEKGKPKLIPGPTYIPLVERAAADVDIPINPEDHRQPTVITEENLRKTAKLRSPNPAFAGTIPSTADDLVAIAEALKAAEDTHQISIDSEAELKDQVANLTTLVTQLLAQQNQTPVQEVSVEAPKKRGRPKKVTAANPMDATEGKQEITSADLME